MPDPFEPVSRVRVRAGAELDVVDVSIHGALVEGDTRLLPNTHVDVHVVSAGGRLLVRCRVVRASVASLAGDRIVYRGALAFEHPVTISGPAAPDHAWRTGQPGTADR